MELISTKRGIIRIKTERTNQFKLIRNNIEIITNELMYAFSKHIIKNLILITLIFKFSC